jgi:hypothetical protein
LHLTEIRNCFKKTRGLAGLFLHKNELMNELSLAGLTAGFRDPVPCIPASSDNNLLSLDTMDQGIRYFTRRYGVKLQYHTEEPVSDSSDCVSGYALMCRLFKKDRFRQAFYQKYENKGGV